MTSVMNRIRAWFDVHAPGQPGTTPDYRFSLANERTYLAWIRTALALIGGGLAVAAFVPADWPVALRRSVATALVGIGAVVAIRAVNHWATTENAMRRGEPMPPSRFPAILAIVTAVGAVVLVVVVLLLT